MHLRLGTLHSLCGTKNYVSSPWDRCQAQHILKFKLQLL